MKLKWIEEEIKYDGSQLRPLFTYLNFEILGDSIISWRGACDVDAAHMVDGEDLLAESEIRGDEMLHFIVEKFDTQLFGAVCLQRLLTAICIEQLKILSPITDLTELIRREGDDVFVDDRKFSISIATQSPTSSMIHFAVNVNNINTPVKTIGLEDFEVSYKEFAKSLMEAFCAEVESITQATQKVLSIFPCSQRVKTR